MGEKIGRPPIPDSVVIRHFAEIIEKYGPLTSWQYDALMVPGKPSRWKVRRVFNGNWATCLEAVKGDFEARLGLPPDDGGSAEVDKDRRIEHLQRQLEELRQYIQSCQLSIEGLEHRFGLISDTHCGSLYADYELLSFAYETFRERGVSLVLDCGDDLDGVDMYVGHTYELERHGEDAQVDCFAERHPMIPGIETAKIDGNHDRSFYKRGGAVTGKRLASTRPDVKFLGFQQADIMVGEGNRKAKVRLLHPGKGTAYAISYHPQKYMEALASGTKPQVLCIGHFHKAEFLPYRNILSLQAGCIQRQTPFMQANNIAAVQGFWIIDLKVGKNLTEITPKFFHLRS